MSFHALPADLRSGLVRRFLGPAHRSYRPMLCWIAPPWLRVALSLGGTRNNQRAVFEKMREPLVGLHVTNDKVICTQFQQF
jgi:hypothetical protein